jgi:apolipoprotein N-acyltransferase
MKSKGFGWDWIDLPWDFDAFWWLLMAVAFVAFMIFVGVPLLIFLAESLLIIPTVVVGLAGRVLFRRPWTIEVLKEGGLGEAIPWEVVGWRASTRAIAQIVGNLEAGSPPLVGLRRALPPAPFRRLP